MDNVHTHEGTHEQHKEPANESTILPVEGKNAEVIHKLASLPHPGVEMKEYTFTFKQTNEDKKLGKPKRDSIKLNLPIPTLDGLANALHKEQVQKFVLRVIGDQIFYAAREQIADAPEDKPLSRQDQLDLAKLTLDALASQPESERRGTGIPKEDWTSFYEDYTSIMPALTGRDEQKIVNAATICIKRLQPVKTNKPALKFIQDQLGIWFHNTSQKDELAEIYAFLDEKAKTFLSMGDEELTQNL